MCCSPHPPTIRMLVGRATHVETGSYGTPTHAAPELLREGRLSPAVDVFAFGVLGGFVQAECPGLCEWIGTACFCWCFGTACLCCCLGLFISVGPALQLTLKFHNAASLPPPPPNPAPRLFSTLCHHLPCSLVVMLRMGSGCTKCVAMRKAVFPASSTAASPSICPQAESVREGYQSVGTLNRAHKMMANEVWGCQTGLDQAKPALHHLAQHCQVPRSGPVLSKPAKPPGLPFSAGPL